MNPTLIGISLEVALFIAMCVWQVYFYRLRKEEQEPEKRLAELKTALACCVTLKEFQEFRHAFERWLNENEDDVKTAKRDIVDLRLAVKGIQSKINGTEWKRG